MSSEVVDEELTAPRLVLAEALPFDLDLDLALELGLASVVAFAFALDLVSDWVVAAEVLVSVKAAGAVL